MLAEEKKRRQTELEKKIFELSKSLLDDAGVRNILLQLLEIYKGDFRHNYSSFFPIIVEISKDDNELDLDFLSNNLLCLRDHVEKDYVSGEKEFKDIYDPLQKLFDHINTEIGRWNYFSQNEKKIEDIKTQSATLNAAMSDAAKKLEHASKQATSIQTELIAVLSVFAAIVVTFSGSFTFLGSVMTSISGVTYYEAVVLEAIICGIVIFNTIFLLMYMVGKITERNIYAKCITRDCSCEKKCNNFDRIRKRLPYVFYFNIVCIAGIIVNFIVWYIDIRDWLGL